MRVVQPGDVHARLDHAQKRLRRARGGTDGGDDLRAAHRPQGIGHRGGARWTTGVAEAAPVGQREVSRLHTGTRARSIGSCSVPLGHCPPSVPRCGSRTSAGASSGARCLPCTMTDGEWRCGAREERCSSSCSAPRPRASSLPRASTARVWSCSGRPDIGKVLCAVLAQRGSHPRALISACAPKADQQLALAVDRCSGDHPAHGQPLEQELDRPLPGILPCLRSAPLSRAPARTRGAPPL